MKLNASRRPVASKPGGALKHSFRGIMDPQYCQQIVDVCFVLWAIIVGYQNHGRHAQQDQAKMCTFDLDFVRVGQMKW